MDTLTSTDTRVNLRQAGRGPRVRSVSFAVLPAHPPEHGLSHELALPVDKLTATSLQSFGISFPVALLLFITGSYLIFVLFFLTVLRTISPWVSSGETKLSGISVCLGVDKPNRLPGDRAQGHMKGPRLPHSPVRAKPTGSEATWRSSCGPVSGESTHRWPNAAVRKGPSDWRATSSHFFKWNI